MKEIGGYIESEHYSGVMLHENAVKLNSGRNALKYILRSRKIKKILLPYYLCDSVSTACLEENVSVSFYHIGYDFLPVDIEPDLDEWVYVVNYYGQISAKQLERLSAGYGRVIIDNAQAYFEEPIKGADTLYTCRKFFGVPDGALLYTDSLLEDTLPIDRSYTRMTHLLGRFENSASEFYQAYRDNEEELFTAPLKHMSPITENLLRAVDYAAVKAKRTENFERLHSELAGTNKLALRIPNGAFSYPLLVDNGYELRKWLIENKVYVPVLWPNVTKECAAGTVEHNLASNLLPLPCDQRYSALDMDRIISLIQIYKG